MDFEIAVETDRPFPEAVAAVKAATADAGFRVLHVHDVRATLAEKGFERGEMVIVEVCNSRHAHRVLEADPRISLMLPCRIAVWAEGGRTRVGTMRPTMIATFYPDAGIDDTAAEVEDVLRRIVEAAR